MPLPQKPMRLTMLLGQSDVHTGEILVWGIVGIGIVIAGLIAVAYLRRRFRDDEELRQPGSGGFSLTDLREMHQQGKLTAEEFERAKHAIVEATKAAAAARQAESDDRGPGGMGAGGSTKGIKGEKRDPRDFSL